MFEDSLLASTVVLPRRRGWMALISLTIQSVCVASVIISPYVIYGASSLPLRPTVAITSPPGESASAEGGRPHTESAQTVTSDHVIRVPANIPRAVVQIVDLPPSLDLETNSKTGGRMGPFGAGGPQISQLMNPTHVEPTIATTMTKRWKVSGGVEQGLLIQEVRPAYPSLARRAGVQGEVVLQAVIGKDGRIENLHAVSGNALLIKAALDAVSRWRYRPYLLNGEPVEVETQITVKFTMS